MVVGAHSCGFLPNSRNKTGVDFQPAMVVIQSIRYLQNYWDEEVRSVLVEAWTNLYTSGGPECS